MPRGPLLVNSQMGQKVSGIPARPHRATSAKQKRARQISRGRTFQSSHYRAAPSTWPKANPNMPSGWCRLPTWPTSCSWKPQTLQGPVLVYSRGRPTENVTVLGFGAVQRSAGQAESSLDCVIHSCRHTFCTRLGDTGADAFTIQKLAGYSSITISQRYVHPSGLESAISKLNAPTEEDA